MRLRGWGAKIDGALSGYQVRIAELVQFGCDLGLQSNPGGCSITSDQLGELGLSLQRQYPSEVLATDPHGQASGFGSLAQTGFWLCWSDGTDAINASETDCVARHVGLELGIRTRTIHLK